MPDYPEKLAELLDHLGSLDDRQERIQVLIDLSKRLRPVPEAIAKRPYPEEARVPACDSEAYVWAEDLDDGTLRYHFAVENPQGVAAMALAVILDEALCGQPAATAESIPPEIIHEIFGEDLSIGKALGLMGMISMIHSIGKKKAGSESRS